VGYIYIVVNFVGRNEDKIWVSETIAVNFCSQYDWRNQIWHTGISYI